MHRLLALVLAALLLGLLPAGGPGAPAAQAQEAAPADAAPADATPAPRLVVGGVAAGGQIRITGYGLPANKPVILRLVTPQGPPAAAFGPADVGALGILPRVTRPLPDSVGAGLYIVQAVSSTTPATVLAQTAIRVWEAPEVTLSPASARPGAEVRVTVRNLIPGTLRLDYAGRAVIGPVAVGGGEFQGRFIVPDEPAGPVIAALPVVASNIVGDRLIGRGDARFVPLAGSARPDYAFEGVAVSPAELRAGEPFTITGRIVPAPSGPFAPALLAPYWARRDGRPFPLRASSASIAADGAFTLVGQVPSVLRGDPIVARDKDNIGVSLVGLDGASWDFEVAAQMADSLMLQFAVAVVKDKPGAPDDRQPIPNSPMGAIDVEIEPVGTMGLTPEQLDDSVSLDAGTPVLDLATINSILGGQQLYGQIQDLNDRINHCFLRVPNVPRWEWGMGVEETVVLSSLELEQFQLPTFGGLAGPGRARPADAPGGLDPGELLVQVFKVTVDASAVSDSSVSPTQKGYGVVNAENKALKTTRYFVYVPERGDTYQIGADNTTATKVAYPAPIALPPLPVGWGTGISLRETAVSTRVLPPGSPESGPFYSFVTPDNPGLQSSISFDPATPITVAVRLALSVAGGQAVNPDIRFAYGGQEYPAQVGTDPEPPPRRCNDDGPPPVPEKFYYFTVPQQGHAVAPGLYPVSVRLYEGGQPKTLRSFGLRFVDYRPAARILDAQGSSGRRVQWRPWNPRLTAVPAAAQSSVGESMPYAGQQSSQLGTSATVVTVLTPAGDENMASQTGDVGSQAMNNAGKPLGFGMNGATLARASKLGAPLDGVGIQSGGPEYSTTEEILDTGRIPITQFSYGVPGIATLSMSIHFRVRASASYGMTSDLGLYTLLDSSVAVGITADIDILLGLASAEITFSPLVGVQIPAEFRWAAAPVDVDKCFYYKLIVSWTIDALWGAVEVTDGSATIFQGAAPSGCYTNVSGQIVPAQQAAPPVPESNPSLATDGLGTTLKLWRAADGNIMSSLMENGAWQAAQPVTAGGRHGDPAVVFYAPGKALAVWSKSGLAAPPAQGTSIADILRQQHLAYALWEGGAWSAPQHLTEPGAGDGKVALAACPATGAGCPAGGQVTAAWVHDAAADVAQRQLRVVTASFQGGAWGPAQQADPASTAAETEPAVVYRGAEPLLLWVRDADRDVNTLGDRRLALRSLVGGAVAQPAEIPAGILRPSAAVDGDGNLQLAFTVARQEDGPVSNRQALHRAVGGCGAGAACAWAVAEQQDALGRSLYAEGPVVTVDDTNRVTLTYRAMGFGPVEPSGAPLSSVPETVGTLTGAGDLAQVELPAALATGGAVMPAYLTSDGAVNWRPAAVYDPALNSTLVLAVKGQAPAVGGAAALAGAQAAPPAQSADPSLVALIAPRVPDFAIAGAEPEAPGENGIPRRVRVRVHNGGRGWASAGAAPLTVQALWDGPRGVGTPAGQATLTALPAGGVAELTLELKAPPGRANNQLARRLLIVVNPGQGVGEARADDNGLTLLVGGLPRPADVQVATREGAQVAALSWAPSADPRVKGYRIYRVVGDGLAPVGSSFTTSWVDPALRAAPGQSVRYVVTSYGEDMVESAPSIPAEARVRGAQAAPGQTRIFLPLVRR